MKGNVGDNIVKYYLYKIFAGSTMRGPILVTFMTNTCGMSLSEVYFCEACCVIVLALLQIPMGILADRWGRAKTIRVGSFFMILELICFATATEHIQLWIANALWAVGLSMLDGAESALLYDSLKQTTANDVELKNVFRKICGKSISTSLIFSSLLCLSSTFVTGVSIRIPLIVDASLTLISFIFSLTLVEPDGNTDRESKHPTTKSTIDGIRLAIYNKQVLWIIAFATLISVTSKLWFFTYNPYFDLVGLDLKYFGLVFFVINVAFAITSFYANQIAKKLENMLGITTSIGILTIPVIAMGMIISKWSISLILFQNVVRGYIGPFIDEMLNRRIDSVNRATALSVKSAIHKSVEVLCMAGFGILISRSNLSTALTCLGITSTVFGLILIVYYSKWFRE